MNTEDDCSRSSIRSETSQISTTSSQPENENSDSCSTGWKKIDKNVFK